MPNDKPMSQDATSHALRRASGGRHGTRRLRIGALIVLALLIGFVLWLVLRGGSNSSSASPIPQGAKAVPISLKALQTLSRLGIEMYWAGPRPGHTYELTKTSDNRVFIRYLPAGVSIGTDKPYLTVGTYPARNAFAAIRRLATGADAVRIGVGKDGVAFYNRDAPESVLLAYRGSAFRVLVYDPSPDRARQVVASGKVTTVK